VKKFIYAIYLLLIGHSALALPDKDIHVYAGKKMAMCTELMTRFRAEELFESYLKKIKLEGPLNEAVRLNSDNDVQGLFYGPENSEPIVKLEFRPSDRPICGDCIYVDDDLEGLIRTQIRLRIHPRDITKRLVHATINDLPYKSKSVDVFIVRFMDWFEPSLETKAIVDKAFNEITRVLKNDGIFVIVGNSGYRRFQTHFDAFVVRDQSLIDRGIHIPEIDEHEINVDGFLLSPVNYTEHFLLSYNHLALAAQERGFFPVWFRSPSYDGLIISRSTENLSRARVQFSNLSPMK
jgi:SAM-dependent methyltransferase